MKKEELFEYIFENEGTSVVGSYVNTLKEEEGIKSVELCSILNLDKNGFSKEALTIIDILENEEGFPYQDLYQSLKWKISSLINIQDLFTGKIFENFNVDTFNAKTYFYFEGLHLIREYFYCGFNNYLSAAQHLLRTFIEFNIKQCYFDFICKANNSYAPLEDYLKNGVSPSALKMANTFLPQGSFAKPIKKKIQVILGRLSDTSSHAYKPIDSMRGNGKLQHEYSLDTMLFWLSLNQSINIVLWSYYLSNPMIFKPKDIIRKFGFNYPIGTFISDFQHLSAKYSLNKDDFYMFMEFVSNLDEVKMLDEFYESQPDLTDDEIKATWDQKESLEDFNFGFLQLIAKHRAMSELLASRCSFDAQKHFDKSLKPLIYKVSDYNWWKKNYKKMK